MTCAPSAFSGHSPLPHRSVPRRDIKRKIALFCDVNEEAVITALDVDTIYEVPLVLKGEGLDQIILKQLSLPLTRARTEAWENSSDRIKNPVDELTIHVVGKCTGYEFLQEPQRSGLPRRLRPPSKVKLNWVEAEALEEGGAALPSGADGILVPGGFGSRGTRRMMKASEYAREHGVPFFGICYGFQWATVEFARNVCGLEGADSTEVDENAPHKVIYKLRDLLGVDELGGTMRLGRYACELALGSVAERIYGASLIYERHRHRFEFNCLYAHAVADRERDAGVGRSPDGKFVEIAELRRTRGFLPCSFTPSSSRVRCSRTALCELRRSGAPAQDGRAGDRRNPRCDGRDTARRASAIGSCTPYSRRPDDRRRPPARVPGWAVRDRARRTRWSWRPRCARSPRAAVCGHLQSVVRQSQPHIAGVVPRPGARGGSADAC